MKVNFDVHGSSTEGELVKMNKKTCVVKYQEPEDKGGKVKIFKRHNKRHNVVCIDDTIKFVELSMETKAPEAVEAK